MLTKIIDLLLFAFLAVTSADLLILYYLGAWYDPNPAIELAEIIILVIFVLGSIARIIVGLKRFK